MTEEYKEPIFDGDYDQDDLEDNSSSIEYDIFVSPNDFNVKTLFDFIESRVFKIPNFQRNYVWDIKRASKLIESLLIGIPIPQIFLFEEKKNNFLVIDGQQRLMTIYYFIKKRFPKKEKRIKLRKIFDEKGSIPDNILSDNDYFTDFTLNLPEQIPNKPNKFNKKNYSTLEESDKTSFNLKTIRHTVIKSSASGEEGNNVVFEIFNRLNTGGVNLKPQEIRTSLYHSNFYELLYKLNLKDEWRKLLSTETPDINMKEVEILLRGFAMLIDRENYKPSMTKFLNGFSFKAKKNSDEENKLLENIFNYFILHINSLGDSKIFWTSNNRFNISVYEAVFTTLCENAYKEKDASKISHTEKEKIESLKKDEEFIKAYSQRTTSVDNTQKRSEIAKRILLGNG
ncbi:MULTISPECIES: DUF262 domain-containing protein [Capnocytophaga]|uniref:GmrSD restriction endonuclease domain-containing protein n=1 Tax=Capnocytophaga TaxID=1016 RepID=UPI00020C5CEC|nr:MULTISPECIES: DUF262 domain-containing protein [unclassified Capnocytophaga]KHE71177.1 hypothetical protein HMPREF9074_07174 [Capnocytophaga sp. oral taxon 329 str. F0087]QGS18529.1 DUF262 domain-containing protein [Capnocytophaga sp. FDAARGOS_737]